MSLAIQDDQPVGTGDVRSADLVHVRPARSDEVPTLEQLIAASARALSAGFYTPREIEAAIEHVFGVDTELVRDGTYLVALVGTEIAGCGGWSRRRTLFGGDRFAARDDATLDPAVEPARIRAFFTAPGFARAGVASALLVACETAAAEAGFTRLALMATLPGVPFYAAHGFEAEEPVALDYSGVILTFVPMSKAVLHKGDTE